MRQINKTLKEVIYENNLLGNKLGLRCAKLRLPFPFFFKLPNLKMI